MRARVFQNHIHNMRGIAILGIVGAHSLHAFDWSAQPLVFRAFDTLCNQSSILFFFIAGYLFQHLSPRFRTGRYWRKKLETVILPYVVLSIPALVAFTAYLRQDSVWAGFYDEPLWKQVLLFLATGKHLAPFWFVPTITLFYVAAPLLVRLDRDGRVYYLLPLLVLLSAWGGRDVLFGPFGKATYLASIYLGGMFFSRRRERCEELAARWRRPLLALELVLFVWNTVDPDAHHAVLYFQKLVLIPLGVHYLRVWDRALGRRFDYLAHMSFGLFFVHGYVIAGGRLIWRWATGDEALPEARVIAYLLFAGLVTALSLAFLAGCRRLFGERSRMVVGC